MTAGPHAVALILAFAGLGNLPVDWAAVALMLLAVAFLALVALLCALSDQWLPLWVAALAFAGLSFALLLAWWREGRSILPFSALLKTPLYVLWKIPIYVGFYINRQRGWNRTRREGESDDGSSATR